MSGSLQLSIAAHMKIAQEGGGKCSSQRGDPVEVQKFSLDDIKGPVCTTQKVTILPFGKSMYALVPVSKDTICGFTLSWN